MGQTPLIATVVRLLKLILIRLIRVNPRLIIQISTGTCGVADWALECIVSAALVIWVG
jgi:hypothetical protein